jgi:hypothetical protein
MFDDDFVCVCISGSVLFDLFDFFDDDGDSDLGLSENEGNPFFWILRDGLDISVDIGLLTTLIILPNGALFGDGLTALNNL